MGIETGDPSSRSSEVLAPPTAAIASCMSLNPPAICSLAFRFRRRACDFEVSGPVWAWVIELSAHRAMVVTIAYVADKAAPSGAVFYFLALRVFSWA